MDPIDEITNEVFQQPAATQQVAQDGFALAFEDLLQIVLTQLTFQDPLEPMDNFEFVSQLAQFTQIQQTQSLNDNSAALLQAEAASQATSLLGRIVDVPRQDGQVSVGRVLSVSFENSEPRLTLQIDNEQTLSNVGLSSITQIREAN